MGTRCANHVTPLYPQKLALTSPTGVGSRTKATDFSLVLVECGREIWSLTLREERRLRVFENRVLRRVSGHKKDVVTGE